MTASSIPSLQQSFSSLHAYWLDAGATGPLPSCFPKGCSQNNICSAGVVYFMYLVNINEVAVLL